MNQSSENLCHKYNEMTARHLNTMNFSKLSIFNTTRQFVVSVFSGLRSRADKYC